MRGICLKGEAEKLSRKEIDKLADFVKTYRAKGLAWMKVAADGSMTSSFAKFLTEDEIAALAEAERRFWEDNVKKGVPPAPSGSDGTDKTISAVYPNDNGDIDTVDITPFASEVQRYITLTDRIKTYDREKNAIKQRIQLYMQDAGRAKCDIAKVSWKSQTRSRYDTEKLIADFVPAGTDLSAYRKTITIRPFRLEEIKNG